jgi:hypothetical protein
MPVRTGIHNQQRRIEIRAAQLPLAIFSWVDENFDPARLLRRLYPKLRKFTFSSNCLRKKSEIESHLTFRGIGPI